MHGRSRHFLLAGDRPRRPFARARVGVGALAPDRQAAAMAQPSVAAQVHQPLDVHGRVPPQIAFDDEVAVDRLADLQDLRVRQVVDATQIRDADLLADLLGSPRPDAVDVLECNDDALLRRNVYACNTGHVCLPKIRRRSIMPGAPATSSPYDTTRTHAHGPPAFSAPDPIACVPSRESGGLVTRVSAPVNRPETTVALEQIYPRSSFDLVQDRADFAGHVVDGAHAVHRPQRALAVVVADERRRLAVVDHQPVRHRFRGVVVAPRERRSLAHVADAADLRPAKAIMVALPAGG